MKVTEFETQVNTLTTAGGGLTCEFKQGCNFGLSTDLSPSYHLSNEEMTVGALKAAHALASASETPVEIETYLAIVNRVVVNDIEIDPKLDALIECVEELTQFEERADDMSARSRSLVHAAISLAWTKVACLQEVAMG